MIWFTIFLTAVSAAWMPAKYLSRKWKRGLLAIIAALVGVISSYVCTLAVVFVIDFVSPQENSGQLVVDLLSVCILSFIISPFAAWWGWRSTKTTGKPSSSPSKPPDAFENLKPK